MQTNSYFTLNKRNISITVVYILLVGQLVLGWRVSDAEQKHSQPEVQQSSEMANLRK